MPWPLMFEALCVLLLGALCWKSLHVLDRAFRDRDRASDRERHDLMGMVQRILEERDLSRHGMSVAQIHAQERMAQLHADTQRMKDSDHRAPVSSDGSSFPPGDEFNG